jgi:hypothetical protein
MTSTIISTPMMMTGVVVLKYTVSTGVSSYGKITYETVVVVTVVVELPYRTGVAETGYEIVPPVPVVSFGRQVPCPDGLPLRHLQLEEQPSPGVPLRLPSSHSSPSEGSQIPLPQPAGVAPRLMMYGRPIDPSPKV